MRKDQTISLSMTTGLDGPLKNENGFRETDVAPGRSWATIEEIMTVEEMTAVQDWRDAKALVEVECAGHVEWQDLDKRATDTIISFPLFLKHLKAMGKWDPSVNTESDVRQMILRTPPRKMEWGGICLVVHGAYIIPIAVDKIWIHQLTSVLMYDTLPQSIIIGKRTLTVTSYKDPFYATGRILLDAESGTEAALIWGGRKLRVRALLDTGASINLMTSGLRKAFNLPTLVQSTPKVLNADRTLIKSLGVTPELPTRLNSCATSFLNLSYLVIGTKGKDQLILGRSFISKYKVMLNLPECWAEIGHQPDEVWDTNEEFCEVSDDECELPHR